MPNLELVSSPSIIAVVQVVDYYKEACRALENSDTASMLGKIQKDWKKLVQMKIYYFAAIAHVRTLRSYWNGWLFKKNLFNFSFPSLPSFSCFYSYTWENRQRSNRNMENGYVNNVLSFNPSCVIKTNLCFIYFTVGLPAKLNGQTQWSHKVGEGMALLLLEFRFAISLWITLTHLCFFMLMWTNTFIIVICLSPFSAPFLPFWAGSARQCAGGIEIHDGCDWGKVSRFISYCIQSEWWVMKVFQQIHWMCVLLSNVGLTLPRKTMTLFTTRLSHL